MNIVKASNESKGILITCPHCKLGSRYDSSYVEDAIKINHNIICVACGGEFNLILSPIEEAVEQSRAVDPPSALAGDDNSENSAGN